MKPSSITNLPENIERTMIFARPVLHEIIHYRTLTNSERKRRNLLTRLIGHDISMLYKPQRFNHVCIAIDLDGRCFIGIAKMNACDKIYRRREGFHTSLERALKALSDRGNKVNGDFHIGHHPPSGGNLTTMVFAKLRALAHQREFKHIQPFRSY